MDMNEVLELGYELHCTDRYVYNNKNVPRATEIISKCIHEDAIVSWSNSLGFKKKKYRDVLNYAAEYGSKVHYGIECYLKNKDIDSDTPSIPLEAFKNWWNQITYNNRVTIMGQEVKLVCEWYGGTYDLLIKINDKICLVDFKTSNHITYKYYIQLASYNKILREKHDIQVDAFIILKLDKNKPIFEEYVLDMNNEQHRQYLGYCERTFMSMVYLYYHIYYLEERFNDEYKK